MRALPLALVAIALAGPAMAQTAYESPREANALRDIARAQERQADELRHLRQVEQDRARQEDRDRRNAATMSRSSRRFDRR
ncbi:hypothetical protein [Methylobacterium aerolatum]|uniref:Uncharacterized protein n=1 Tax=Methylobacterium aerolatum TaxID=418708 RepID=A0ABU0I0E4_9HYPH|nr:hypothetical protein [Methylobacterium aerolatum]MDQ0448066.1 hypothetical protein [Methylobacterium aerolatum]GJD36463.1 hypothetical protein FMGBMHLM_3383 [Methylobacterium aerolatum]